MENVLVITELYEGEENRLKAAAPGLNFTFKHRSEAVKADFEQVNVMIGEISPEEINRENFPVLRLLQLDSAGADSYAKLDIFRGENAAALCNATGAYGVTISEYMLGMLINLSRHFQLYRDAQLKHSWKRLQLPDTLNSKNALILGFGDIGQNLAVRLKAMGCNVTAIRRTVKDVPSYVDRVCTMDSLNELLPEADFICMSLPQSPQTRHIINEETLSLMKESALIVNVGRGSAIDSDALAKALSEGRIGGAALDVTEPEPLPEDHPLWSCENCIITPHVAGLNLQRDPHERILRIAEENLRNYVEGKPFINVVDLETGYKRS